MAKDKKKATARYAADAPSKSFLDMIAPSVVKFNPDHFICGNTFRCVWALREYPTQTDEQALLRHLGEKDGITLRIYTRQLTPAEEDRIIQNATNKNRMGSSNTNDLRQTVTAESNLQDVASLIASMHRNREPLFHCAVYLELTAPDYDALKLLQTDVLTELVRSKLNVDKLLLRQQQGFCCVSPVGYNAFGAQFERVLPANSVANLYPFNYSGKTDAKGFYIGKDKYGSNILVDFDQRDEDKTSANILILGNSGQGKSYLMKLLILNLLESGKSVITLDAEHEQQEMCEAVGGCFADLMAGQYIINVLEPKCWDDGGDPDDTAAPEAFRKSTLLSQHISFLKDFFRAYKDFSDAHIDTIEIMLSKLYQKWGITDRSNFVRMRAEDYVRKLKLLGVGVQFEKEGISTLSMGDEMLLNTFSALAQEESQSISMNQRLSIVKRMELGEYVDSNAPYGYRLVDKMLTVYEPEAGIVRNIFALYLQGFSTSEIARELNKLNIPTKAGKEIWRPSRVAYILKNERYIGDSFYQKTYRETTVPFNQHPNRGQEDRFYAKGTHPGIVEKDVFDAAQILIEKRKDVFAKATTQNIYPLTSRIQCSECGSFYRRRIVSGTVKWVCSLHKDDSTACDSNYYSEERIYDGFISMVNKLRFSEDNILGQVISRLEMTLAAMKRNNLAARDLSKSIAELNAKLLMLEQLRSKGYLAPEVYQAQANEISAELAKLKDVRQEKFNSKAAIMLEEVKKLKMLIFELEEPLDAFDEKLFLEIVKSIQINKEDEMSVELLGGLRFRERI